MKIKLLLILFLALTGTGKASAALTVTQFIDSESGNDGDLITTNLLSTVTRGFGVWQYGVSAEPLTSARIKVGFNTLFQGPVTISGTEYAGSGTRSLAFTSDIYQWAQFNFIGGCSNVTVSCFITAGPTNDFDWYDMIGIQSALDYAVANYQYDALPANRAIKIHTQTGVSAGFIHLQNSKTYFVSLSMDCPNMLASLAVYDPVTWLQVESTLTLPLVFGNPAGFMRIGALGHHIGEEGYFPTVTYFDNLIMSTNAGAFPLLPLGQSNTPRLGSIKGLKGF